MIEWQKQRDVKMESLSLRSFRFSKTKEEVKKILNHSDQSIAHQWPHTKRVLNNCRVLAQEAFKSGVKVNLENLMLAAMGHDLVQPYQADKAEHVENSIEKFKTILQKNGHVEKMIEKVLKIMSEHSSETINPPTSFEAKILWIADKWDGVGQEGVYRALAYCKQRGMSKAEAVQWYKEKIEKAKPLFLELIKEVPGSGVTLKDVEYSRLFIEEFEKKNYKMAV